MPESEPRVFTHDRALYVSRVYGEGVLGAIVAVVSLERVISGGEIVSLWLIPLIVGIYAAVRLLVTGSVPRSIVIEDDRVVFTDPRRVRSFALADIADFRVREFTSSATVYLRIKPLQGREQKYWIEWKAYSDGEDLLYAIRALDNQLNPQSLKATAGVRGYSAVQEGPRGA